MQNQDVCEVSSEILNDSLDVPPPNPKIIQKPKNVSLIFYLCNLNHFEQFVQLLLSKIQYKHCSKN